MVAERPCSRAATSPVRSWRRARSPTTRTTGTPVAAAPRADETTPSMPLAPRLASGRMARGPDGSQASMSRTGIELLAHRIAPSVSSSPRRANRRPFEQLAGLPRGPAATAEAWSAARSAASQASHQVAARAGGGRSRLPPSAARPPRGRREACAVAAASAWTNVVGMMAGSRQPPSPSLTSCAGRRSSRSASSSLEVGGAPTRTTTSGRWASRQGPGRSSRSPRSTTRERSCGPQRTRERGSATTGQSRAAARRATAAGREGSSCAPATRRPRSARARRRTSASTSTAPASRRPATTSTKGESLPGPPSSGPRGPSGTSGSRNGTTRCTGPAGLPSAVANARPARAPTWRRVTSAPSRSGSTRAREPPRMAPEEPHLVDGLGPSPVPPLGRAVAVRTTRGTRPSDASTTAGRMLAAAVPEVTTTATGRRDASPCPWRRSRRSARRGGPAPGRQGAPGGREGERC